MLFGGICHPGSNKIKGDKGHEDVYEKIFALMEKHDIWFVNNYLGGKSDMKMSVADSHIT